jgi:O-antigen ligase
MLVALLGFILSSGVIPRGICFPGVALSFLIFIVYAWVRLDDAWALDIFRVAPDGLRPGLSYVLDLIIYYALFVTAALVYYKKSRFSIFLWFLICGYIVAFIIRNSLDIAGLQEGYNLSPGFVLVTLLPFVFLMHGDRNKVPLIPSVLLFFCIIWLALIGARTAVGALLIFWIVMRVWPTITRSRFMYFATFWAALLFIACVTVLYVLYTISDPTDSLLKESLIEDSGVGIFHKSIGTRIQIWVHLLFLISQQPVFGYGTDHATFLVSPLSFLEFTLNRDNLSAHSTYFELLYRLGAVGLLGFILIMFSIWKLFWSGREHQAARVAGAFLVSILFFCSTGEYLVFNDLQLRSGFGWIILGIGAGACLRAMKDARRRSSVYLGGVPESGQGDRSAIA